MERASVPIRVIVIPIIWEMNVKFLYVLAYPPMIVEYVILEMVHAQKATCAIVTTIQIMLATNVIYQYVMVL